MQREVFAYSVRHRAAPSEESLEQVVSEAPTPADGLVSLWRSGKLPHRQWVMDYLRGHDDACRAQWAALRPVVLDALASGDFDQNEPAEAVLCRRSPEDAAGGAAALLADADPDVRLAGIRAASQLHDLRFVPRLIDALGDREGSVAVTSVLSLQPLTGRTLTVNARDPATFLAAQADVRQWWTTHRPAGTPEAMPPAMESHPTDVPAADFQLDDLAGRPVRLSDYRGKAVLLNFWATWCGPCVDELPTLSAFQDRHRGGLVVVGVSADAVADDDGDTPDAGKDPTAKVKAVAAGKHVGYTMVVDRDGKVVGAYGGSGIPLSILIDPAGRVRRRFLGPRSGEALDKMLAALDEK